jgi:hypothetical protein
MLDECYEFSSAVHAKGELFSTESLLMALIFMQQKMINQLIATTQVNKNSDIE